MAKAASAKTGTQKYGKIFHAAILALIGCIIVHITVLLLLPAMPENDAWSRLAATHELNTFVPVSDQSGALPVLQSPDPYFEAAICRFDLDGDITRIHGDGNVPYWSASIYNRHGENIYSLNDRATPKGNLDIILLSPAQMMEQRQNLAKDFGQSIFIDTPVEEGIIVVRAFAPDPSWKPGVSAYIKGLSCSGA